MSFSYHFKFHVVTEYSGFCVRCVQCIRLDQIITIDYVLNTTEYAIIRLFTKMNDLWPWLTIRLDPFTSPPPKARALNALWWNDLWNVYLIIFIHVDTIVCYSDVWADTVMYQDSILVSLACKMSMLNKDWQLLLWEQDNSPTQLNEHS